MREIIEKEGKRFLTPDEKCKLFRRFGTVNYLLFQKRNATNMTEMAIWIERSKGRADRSDYTKYAGNRQSITDFYTGRKRNGEKGKMAISLSFLNNFLC